MNAVWYRRTVTVPGRWAGRNVLLHFQAVDYDATVWVNGVEVAGTAAASRPSPADLSGIAKAGEPLTIVVRARDHARLVKPRGKQSDRYGNYGCLYTRTTGIWQTVWLEPVPETTCAGRASRPIWPARASAWSSRSAGAAAGLPVRATPARRRRRRRQPPRSQPTADFTPAPRAAHPRRAAPALGARQAIPLRPGHRAARRRRARSSTAPTATPACARVTIDGKAIMINGKPGLPAAGARPGLLPRRHPDRADRRGAAPRHRADHGGRLQRRAPAPEGLRGALPLPRRPAGLPGLGRVPRLGLRRTGPGRGPPAARR